MHVKKDDIVQVIAGVKGKDKGKKAKVLSVDPKAQRVVVEGVNIRKKHLKGQNEQQQGGIIDIEGSIHVSNVMPYCEKCAKGVRVGRKLLEDGKKVRFCRKCGEIID